jgi:cold shock CspA family protein
MAKIALFKWWKTEQENDADDGYKILECEDGRRFLIHHSEIHSAEELKRGHFITFEIEGDAAKNLRPLRKVGVIDSYNRERYFGTARLLINDSELLRLFECCENGTAEVFFHINEVTSGGKEPKRGDVVVVDIRKTYRKDKNQYRDNALNIQFLSTETDGEIIDNCVNSDHIDVLLAVFGCSLNECQYDMAVNSLAHTLPDSSVHEKISLISKLPEEIKKHEKIISFLSTDPEFIDFCVRSDRLDVLLFVMMFSLNESQYEAAINSLANILANCSVPNKISLISKLPEEIKEHEKIITFLSADKKLEFWIKQLNNPEEYEGAIKQISELLQGCSDNKRASVIGKIPLKAKQSPKIFDLLSDDEKIDFLVWQLQKPESYESAINGIAKILDQYPQQKSKSNDNELLDLNQLLDLL